MIEKITFKNYKSFKEAQELNLKPITILIGKNSSGKSAVSKLLTLLSGSLSGDSNLPLKWENEGIKLGLSNKDLIYNKQIATSILEFGVFSSTETLEISISIDMKDRPNILACSINDVPIDNSFTDFRGFRPQSHVLETLRLNYDYIGPIRAIPQSNYVNNFEAFPKIGINGANAYPILIQDYQNKSELVKQVSDWYGDNFEGWKIEVIELSAPEPTFQIVLSNKNIKQINIVNVGQGMNQALPLIVRSFMKDDEMVRIIVEEPETHLHPSAHGSLAQRLVDSCKSDNNKNYLIETHSQNFLLRVRRLVAEKELKVENLAIYYVDFDEDLNESSLTPIIVDEKGGVDWWPDGIFTETLIETRAIRDAQIKDDKDVD